MAKATRDEPWSVSELSGQLGQWIRKLGDVWIVGELTQVQVRPGRVSFLTLKDHDKNQSMTLTASSGVVSGDISAGDSVIVHGHAQWWSTRGTLSLRVDEVTAVGEGTQAENLRSLESDLEAEGLFEPRHKIPLPRIPSKIALITAKGSDAEKDIINVGRDRWPDVNFFTQPVPVQGARTVVEVVSAIQASDADPDVDVIICARGGGSSEDLLPWSDEKIVRAAFASRTPIISAIGHENDCPLLDRVADLRAATPTDAAKRAVPDIAAELAGLDQAMERIRSHAAREIDRCMSTIDYEESLLAKSVDSLLTGSHRDLDNAWSRIHNAASSLVAKSTADIDRLESMLDSLDHFKVLERGYLTAIRADDGTAVEIPASGDRLVITNKYTTFEAVVI